MSFEKLFDILGKAGSRFPALKKRLKEAEALGRWEIAVGPIIAKHSRAVRVQDAVLWVEVDHPIWKSELHHRKHQILTILNAQPDIEGALGGPLEDLLFLEPRRDPQRDPRGGSGSSPAR